MRRIKEGGSPKLERIFCKLLLNANILQYSKFQVTL